MKPVVILTLMMIVIVFAVIGVLTIIDLLDREQALHLLIKSEAAIVFLGACFALLARLVRPKE